MRDSAIGFNSKTESRDIHIIINNARCSIPHLCVHHSQRQSSRRPAMEVLYYWRGKT